MSLFDQKLKLELVTAGYDHPTSICKVFSPFSSATWILFGCDSKESDIVSCVADLGFNCVESGSVYLSELESIRICGFAFRA